MISVKNLSFSYQKNKSFIENLNFDVEKGEIFGFLGPSGAGKSTLQKILTGIITAYSGSVKVNGIEVKYHNNDYYENVGVVFEFPTFYAKFTALENLKLFASLYSKKTENPMKLLEKVGLEDYGDKKVAEFSKGMKTRLNFIKVLLHHPEILFLDEPTSGLDPVNSRIVRDIILEQKKKGRTIILTTHNMYFATELCDRVAFIVDGKIRALDSPKNLIMKGGKHIIKYIFKDGNDEIYRETQINETSKDNILKKAIDENALISIHSVEPTLEDIFVEITGRCLQ